MIRRIFFVSFSIAILSFNLISQEINKHVQTTSELIYNSKLSTINLNIKFQPIKGIHINTEPQIEFIPDLSSSLKIKKRIIKKTNEDYLDTSTPVQFIIQLNNKKIKLDSLKGKLQYYYCSDEEGWCNRFTQNISLPLNIPFNK
ncbi:MAG: hypothetical protein EXR24_04515 [Ignavibacteria bacterium]|nr:hypothetical protein [Ignavibacteria bacterium]